MSFDIEDANNFIVSEVGKFMFGEKVREMYLEILRNYRKVISF